MTSLLCLLLLGQTPPGPTDPPVAGRPVNFSGLVGLWRIAARLDRNEVRVEEPILLTVVLQGQGSAGPIPKQETLQPFPKSAQEDFFIEPVPAMNSASPEKGVWSIVYRLRPKHASVQETPGLELSYWYPPRGRYQRSYADPLPVRVLPPQAEAIAPPPAKTLQFPPDVFELLCTEEDLQASFDRSGRPRNWVVAGFLAPPVVCLGWFFVRRRGRFGRAAREQQERIRAARFALKSLGADPSPEAIAAALRTYLADRFDYQVQEPSSGEVVRFLARRGLDRSDLSAWRILLETCEAARFGRQEGEDLAVLGRRVLEATEVHLRRRENPVAFRRAGVVLAAVAATLGTAGVRASTESHRADSASILAQARQVFEEAVRTPQVDRTMAGQAAELFATLVRRGHRHPHLEHDLGNALLLAGRLPEAVLHYRLGADLAPDQDALRQRLAFARSQVLYGKDDRGRPREDSWPAWLPHPTFERILGLALLCHGLFWVLATRWLLVRGIGWAAAAGAALLAALVAGFISLDLHAQEQDRLRHPLVVVAEETVLRTGNAASFPQHASLPVLGAGMEARRLHRRGDWAMIRFATGEIGWVPTARLLQADSPVGG